MDGWELHVEALGGRDCLRITGLAEALTSQLRGLGDAQLARLLPFLPDDSLTALRAAPAALDALPSMAGRYAVEAGSLCFFPRYPLLGGTRYCVLLHPALLDPGPADLASAGPLRDPGSARRLSAARAGERAEPQTEVIEIYPSCAEIPVNQLKLYVHFSSPMSEGCAARHVRVLRADSGQPLEAVFLDMQPELWDRERRRLTLLLDPGRIKRGLVPNRTDGYPLEAGVPVRVVIERDFIDECARPLIRSHSRSYSIGREVRSKLDPADWQYEFPRAGTREPLRIRFDRPLDRALLQHCIRVTDADRKPLAGELEVLAGESAWHFTPGASWQAAHWIRIDARLEDLAGNSLARVFDRDLARREDAPLDIEWAERRFACL